MALDKISYSMIVCLLIFPLVLGSLLDLSGKAELNGHNQHLEARFLARFLAAKRQKAKYDGEREAERIMINLDDTNVEWRLMDCAKRQEVVVMGNADVCYIHKMDDAFYQSVCLGKGQRVNQFYYVNEEILDKDFLSKDGGDSICRSRKMYNITPITDQKSSTGDLKKGKWFTNWNYIDWPKTY